MSYQIINNASIGNIKPLLEKVFNFVGAEFDVIEDNIDEIQIAPDTQGTGYEFCRDFHCEVMEVLVFGTNTNDEMIAISVLVDEDYEVVSDDFTIYDGDDSSVGNPYGE